MQVNWGGALSIKDKSETIPEPRYLPWIHFCNPVKSSNIIGNRESIKQVNEWFTNVQCRMGGTSCLFVEGSSGVWKSTAIILCAKEHGYQVVHTQSDTQRTPHRLDSILRRLDIMGQGGVLLLDELESFIKETTSLRWLMGLLKSDRDTLVVVVCNAVDKSFHQIRDMSTVVRFYPYSVSETYRTLLLLSQRVSSFCHLPPMDCYFIATMSRGNICQTVNQLHLLYHGSLPLNKKRKCPRMNPVFVNDNPVKMWSVSHRATSIDCFLRDEDILESVSGMGRDFMNSLGENISKEYVWYFHNSTKDSLKSLSRLSDEMSLSDRKVLDDEDRLYDTENSERWSEDNLNYIGCVCRSLNILKGKQKNEPVTKRHIKRVFKF